MDHRQNHDGRNKMDLNLKIGPPYQNDDDDGDNQHVNPDYNANHLSNFNFINPYIAHNQQLASGMINGGGQANAIGMVNLATPINYGMSNIANNMTNMNLNANSALSWPNIPQHNNYYGTHLPLLQYNNNTPAVGIPVMPHHQYAHNFNYGDHTISTESSASSSSSNSRKKESRQQRLGNYNTDMNRRCTNRNCNTNDTPMWRRGPLGSKTLCNACGIKYRKELERRAKDAENNSNNNNA